MQMQDRAGQWWLGICILLGLAILGYQLANAAIRFKQFERSVTVKGLSEREYPADIVIWPIQFSVANNDLGELYNAIESGTGKINAFLTQQGIAADEITVAPPVITDKSAQTYGGDARPEFRYSAMQNVTVYSTNVAGVRKLMSRLSELGKQGIVFTGDNTGIKIADHYGIRAEIKTFFIDYHNDILFIC